MAVFNGSLYVGGEFLVAGGLNSVNLAVWNGSTWVAQPAFNNKVRTLAARIGTTATNSFLFAGGEFTGIGGGGVGVGVNRVARFSPATNSWSAMGSLDACYSLMVRATGLNTYEVLAGNVGVSNASVRRWYGTNWITLGNAAPGLPRSLTYHGGSST